MQFGPQDGVYSYFRYNDKEAVMVIFNKNQEAYSPEMDRFRERTNGFTKGVDAISGKEYQLNNLEIPARGVLVLDLK
jgi:hypothetical protein